MPGPSERKAVNRIIDANINRAKEGLRVCEEITRFIFNSRNLTGELKRIRHDLSRLVKYLPINIRLLRERESLKDVGRNLYAEELKRKDCQDIFFANIQRVKESVRVLEEFTKLINKSVARKFKALRYRIYELEKKVAKEIASLCHRRPKSLKA